MWMPTYPMQATEATTYTNAAVDAMISNKASTADMAAALALKADTAKTYTI